MLYVTHLNNEWDHQDYRCSEQPHLGPPPTPANGPYLSSGQGLCFSPGLGSRYGCVETQLWLGLMDRPGVTAGAAVGRPCYQLCLLHLDPVWDWAPLVRLPSLCWDHPWLLACCSSWSCASPWQRCRSKSSKYHHDQQDWYPSRLQMSQEEMPAHKLNLYLSQSESSVSHPKQLCCQVC